MCPKGSGTSPQSDYVLKRTKLKHTVCFTIQNRGGRRLSEERGSPHSGHGPARHFPALPDHLPRQDYHWVYPDDAPARGGGPERRLEPPADPGWSPT